MILEDITVEDEIDAAREEAFEEGREEGIEIGKKRVLDMVKQGIPIDEIEKQLNRT
jgi:flagellar biosynthesis/type III secretory pathway protein FliH